MERKQWDDLKVGDYVVRHRIPRGSIDMYVTRGDYYKVEFISKSTHTIHITNDRYQTMAITQNQGFEAYAAHSGKLIPVAPKPTPLQISVGDKIQFVSTKGHMKYRDLTRNKVYAVVDTTDDYCKIEDDAGDRVTWHFAEGSSERNDFIVVGTISDDDTDEIDYTAFTLEDYQSLMVLAIDTQDMQYCLHLEQQAIERGLLTCNGN